jgi:hypothetical protein
MMKNINLILLLILVFVSTSHSQVQRINGEKISGNANWQGTVILAGDVIIEQNSRLIIEPGTKVLFEPNQDLTKGGSDKTRSELIVKGTLIARGLPGRKITFSSNSTTPRMGDWYSIEFLHLKTGTLLEYCLVQYAHNGLTIKNSNILINNCEFHYNYHAGIRTEVKANPEINNSIMSENGYAGLICELGSRPVLTDNLVSLNRIGMVVFSLSQPNLGNLTPGEDYNPGRNSIYGNEEFDLYNHSNKKVFAENNHWGDDGRSAIAIKVYDSDDNSKYGNVDYMPVMRQSGQQNLGSMLLLAQNTSEQSTNASTTLIVQETSQTTITVDKSSPATNDSSLQNLTVQDLVNTENVNQENMELSKELEEMSPLIASTSPPERQVRQLPVDSKEVKSQIDYNQVFLEIFLDGGIKKYIYKPKVETTRLHRSIRQKGQIRIKVVVGRDGKVENASILRGINDIIDRVVIETVEKYEYQTGKINGKAVRFTTSEVFRLE